MPEAKTIFVSPETVQTRVENEAFSALFGSRPEYFLVGCTDHPLTVNGSPKLVARELVFHGSVGNVVAPADINTLAALQYAVEILRVKKIIVCGHYECTAVKLSAEGCRLEFLGNWLAPIAGAKRKFADLLEKLNRRQHINALCELNVIEQVANLCRTTIVADAWRRGQDLSIGGIIYNPLNDATTDLNIGVDRHAKLSDSYESAISAFRTRWDF